MGFSISQAHRVSKLRKPRWARIVFTVPGYKAKLERVFRLRLETFDWNCPQHITPRFTEREVNEGVRPLRERVAQLEAENAELRARLAPPKL